MPTASTSSAGKDGTTYTVDATNATIKKAGGAGTLADITVGTMLVAQGTVNGTTVTATMIGTDMPHQMDKQGDAQHKSEKNMKGKHFLFCFIQILNFTLIFI
jgi:hypothetical protein